VLLLMSAAGRPLGFAKVAWTAAARLLIENERRALDYFGSCALEHGVVPRVIHHGDWRGKSILVTEPLDLGGNRGAPPELRDVHVRFLVEIASRGRRVASFAGSSFPSLMQARIERLRESVPDHRLRTAELALQVLTTRLHRVDLPWVWRTGDFVPWNTGVDEARGRIVAVDLEYAAPESVPGWDLFHYLSRSGTALPGRGGGTRVAGTYFSALGIDPCHTPALFAAYLLDLWTMREELWSESCGPAQAAALLRRMSTLLFILLRDLSSGRTPALWGAL
jgi:hypothetical protein